jgi:hypothetical protein
MTMPLDNGIRTAATNGLMSPTAAAATAEML